MMSSHDKCVCSTGDAHYVDQQLRSETQISFALHCVLDFFVAAKSEQLRSRGQAAIDHAESLSTLSLSASLPLS